MSHAIYSPSGSANKPVCVEVLRDLTFVSSTLLSPQSAEIEYTNDLSETITLTVLIPAPHTLVLFGAGFRIDRNFAGILPIEVRMTFDSDFSGSMSWIATEWDNEGYLPGGGGTDKLYDFNIGFPNTMSSNVLLRGSTLISALGDTNPKQVNWENIIDKDFIRFKYLPSSITGYIEIVPTFIKRKIDIWYFDGQRYRNPLTNIFYDILPVDVTLSNCEDENKYISWSRELCIEYAPLAFRPISATNYVPTDPYNNLFDRNDGLPGVFGIPIGSLAGEFNAAGTRIYINDGINVLYGNYDNQTGVFSLQAGFPLVSLMPVSLGAPNLRGCAVNLSNEVEEYYVIHRQVGPNVIHIAKVNPLTGRLHYIGNTGIAWSPSGIIDDYDLTFTKDGRLLYSHGLDIYILDPNDAQVISKFRLTTANITTGYAIKFISRMANGDILVSGADNINPHAWMLDAGNLSIKQEWYFNSSPFTLTTDTLIAYPANVVDKITRVFKQDADTNQISFSDINKNGQIIQLTEFANIIECQSTNDLTWTAELCYKSQTLPDALGNIGIDQATSLINSTPNCSPFGGFVSPAGTAISITHNNIATELYALIGAGNINRYPWTVKATPGVAVPLVVTGIPVGESRLSIRTRWSNNSLWLHTQEIANPFIHRFYEVNKTTGVSTLRGLLTLTGPNPLDAGGSFTWTLDDQLLFSRIANTAGTITYDVSKVDVSQQNFTLSTLLFSAQSDLGAKITTDITTGNIVFLAQNVNRLEYYLTNGDKISTCELSSGLFDFIAVPERGVVINDDIKKVLRVFTKSAKANKVTYYDLDSATGKGVQISENVQLFACDSIKQELPEGRARAALVTGIASWSINANAPTAKSVTITRITNNITINDGINPLFNVNVAFTLSWTNLKITNNLIFAGTAAGSSFLVSWVE